MGFGPLTVGYSESQLRMLDQIAKAYPSAGTVAGSEPPPTFDPYDAQGVPRLVMEAESVDWLEINREFS